MQNITHSGGAHPKDLSSAPYSVSAETESVWVATLSNIFEGGVLGNMLECTERSIRPLTKDDSRGLFDDDPLAIPPRDDDDALENDEPASAGQGSTLDSHPRGKRHPFKAPGAQDDRSRSKKQPKPKLKRSRPKSSHVQGSGPKGHGGGCILM